MTDERDGPDSAEWVPARLAEIVEELRSLPEFLPGIEDSFFVRRTLEELSALTDATRQIARHVPAWYRGNADELYSPSGVYGTDQSGMVDEQIARLDETVEVLGGAEMRLLDASRQAEHLQLREEQRVDPDAPRGLREWWVIEEHSYEVAAFGTLDAYETREAAMWHAGRLAEETSRNSELVVRVASPEGRGEEVARLGGRADISGPS